MLNGLGAVMLQRAWRRYRERMKRIRALRQKRPAWAKSIRKKEEEEASVAETGLPEERVLVSKDGVVQLMNALSPELKKEIEERLKLAR